MSQKFTAMYQYDQNTFSIVHGKSQKPEVGDFAIVVHKTSLHVPDHPNRNQLKISEIIETRSHKTCPNSNISVVVLEKQEK